MNKFYITTAIPYVNANPHIGFAMELIQADVLARYHRLIGDRVHLLAGTDENSLKNVQSAEAANMDVREFVDQKANRFIELAKLMNLSNDGFVRTTEERHIKASQKLWQACDKNGDIYKKKYKGLYCVGCEEFKTPKELVDGLCPEHKKKPDEVEEENYFFKLSKYTDTLLKLIDSGEMKIVPESRTNETREFIKQGLEDFSISRSVARAKNWGIPVPGDDSQIMYVWFDALTNYITELGYGSEDESLFKDLWLENRERCHLIGKGITRFHAIYWPAMLISAGTIPPSKIYVHGYLTVNGEKISKSLGNAIDPFEIVGKYGIDIVRYYLLREVSSGEDGDFSEKRIIERYNGELANGLGNLISRVSTLAEGEFKLGALKNIDRNIYDEAINKFELNKALDFVWVLVAEANQFVSERKPWQEKKDDLDKFNETISILVSYIHLISVLLYPFMPDTSDKILKTFSLDKETVIQSGQTINIVKGEPLFPRL